MPGKLKARTYDLSNTNVAMIGTSLDKAVRKAAAETELAWHNAGTEFGIIIWRIEKFNVVAWPEEEYGNFFSGDSYIILHTYKKKNFQGENEGGIAWDIHFWIGDLSTQDEYGTAAYKTVELDDFLGTRATQYREVQDNESRRFKELFDTITVMEGGVSSGFKHVTPIEYRHRLLQVKGEKNRVIVREVPMESASLNSGDTFIYDGGLEIFVWHGKETGPMELAKGATVSRAMDDERGGKPQITVFEEGDDANNAIFFEKIGGKKGPIKSKEEAGKDEEVDVSIRRLCRVSDASGKMEMKVVASGTDLNRNMLDSSDVFILDDGYEVFCWVGLDADLAERKTAMNKCAEYLEKFDRPRTTPISKLLEGAENELFEQAFEVGVMKGFQEGAKYTGDIDKIRSQQVTGAAAASVTPGGSYNKGPGVTTDFDNFYSMDPVDPEAWKGRSKEESSYAKELQAKKYGAYNPASGWVSSKTAEERAAHEARIEKIEGAYDNDGLSTAEKVIDFNKDLSWVQKYNKGVDAARGTKSVAPRSPGKLVNEATVKTMSRSSSKQIVMKVNKAIMEEKCGGLGNALKPENAELLKALETYGELFAREDTNGTGEIELLELQKCFVDIGAPKSRIQLNKMLKLVDAKDGRLDYGHFAALMMMDQGFMDLQ